VFQTASEKELEAQLAVAKAQKEYQEAQAALKSASVRSRACRVLRARSVR
jgi:hypothetical protein